MGILRNKMIEEMNLRNFAPATQKSYLYAVARLAKHSPPTAKRFSPIEFSINSILSALKVMAFKRLLVNPKE